MIILRKSQFTNTYKNMFTLMDPSAIQVKMANIILQKIYQYMFGGNQQRRVGLKKQLCAKQIRMVSMTLRINVYSVVKICVLDTEFQKIFQQTKV